MTAPDRKLRLASATLMACEADIAEAFVRWTHQFVDRMYVCLNNSHDGTADILAALREEGLPLVLHDTGRGRFEQSELTHQLMEQATRELQPHWMLLLDADEFLDCPDRQALERSMQQHGPRHARVPWVNHAPSEQDDPAEQNPIRRIRHRYDYPVPEPGQNVTAWKTIVNMALYLPYSGRYRIARGNHFLQWRGMDRQSAQPNSPLAGIRLRHYPVRSADQALLKAGLGAANRALHFGHGADFGMQWQRLATALAAPPANSLAVMQESVREYLDYGHATAQDVSNTPLVEDALGTDMTLRYSDMRRPAAVAMLGWIQSQLAPDGAGNSLQGNSAAPASPGSQTAHNSAHHPYLWRRLGGGADDGNTTGYPDKPRTELLTLIGDPGPTFLDVGCWSGATAKAIKERFPAVTTTGIERDGRALAIARARLDSVIAGDLEASPGPEAALANGTYSTILCADVLEHLVDPWSLLLRLRRLLAPGGRVVVSVPNVFNLQLIDNLARERWDYAPDGLLDVTHLRFFTRETLCLMLQETGYLVQSIHPLTCGPGGIPAHTREGLGAISTTAVTLKGLDPDRLRRLFVLQHVAIATAG